MASLSKQQTLSSRSQQQALPVSSEPGSQLLATVQHATEQRAAGAAVRTLSELRRELDYLNTDKRQRLSQVPATGQRASDHKAPAPGEAHRALFSELRCELDTLNTAKKRQRLGHSVSGCSASTARTAPQAAPDAYRSLPTTFSWFRNNAQTGGLLEWAMDELHHYWHEEVHSAAGQRTRALRGRLTCDQAVVIFVARRYVPRIF